MRYDFQTLYSEQFVYIIDNQKYIFKATLNNPEGDQISLTKSSILNLIINDNLFDPWISGEIILDNTEDALERFVSDPTEREFNPKFQKSKGYTVRGDARDFLLIEIVPIESNALPFLETGDAVNSIFGLKYIFCIEDYEALTFEGKKALKLIISDYDKEVLRERKLFYTSVDTLNDATGVPTDTTLLSNSQRAQPTGAQIKYVLQKALNDTKVILTETSDDGNSVTPEFETGASSIFYSSPSGSTAYDDLMYLLNYHVSDAKFNDFSFLKKLNNSGEYVLRSAAFMFSQAYTRSKRVAGKRLFENFTITGGETETDGIVENERKRPDGTIELGEKGDILEYKFFNTSGRLFKEKVKARIVHSYDFKDKEFNIDIEENSIVAAKDKFTSNYVEPMPGKNNNPSPNFPLTQMQVQKHSYEDVFSVYGNNREARKAIGINRLLKNALIVNMGVEIVVKGQLQRKVGTFFSLDRKGNYIDNDFDNKLLGVYFIIDVQHEFSNDSDYFNKIIALKTYHFDDPKYKENIL
tara:strand:+ start:987 stop:2561 length:1575 start_codon:yes stop_codon:yes gene_type:complete